MSARPARAKGATGASGAAARPDRPQRPPRPQRPATAPLPGFADAPERSGLGWQAALAASVTGLGYDLVDVERAGHGLLRVTIDRVPGRVYGPFGPDGQADAGEAVTVDDCERVTRQLQYVLEVEGLDYARLEVSSPGLDRPLRHEADYRRFAGLMARVTLREPFEGRRHWEGLLGVGDAGGFTLTLSAQAPAGGARGKAAKAPKPGKAPRQPAAAADTARVLGFTLDEVREARLVPVLDFKGRRPGAAPAAPPGDGPDMTTTGVAAAAAPAAAIPKG